MLICCYTTSSTTRVDAFVVTIIISNRRRIPTISHIAFTIINNNSHYNGSVGIRNSLLQIHAHSKEDGDRGHKEGETAITNAATTTASTVTGTSTIEELIQSKLDNCLTRDQISSVLQHQPKAMNLNNSILSSQEEITAKRIGVAAAVFDWFLTAATVTQSSGFKMSQVAKIVTGHPPILTYDIETNLVPTVDFYNDALLQLLRRQGTQHETQKTPMSCSDYSDSSSDGGINIVVDPQTVAFLCENPKLLEFNAKKRLKPRFEAYEKTMKAIAQQSQQQDGTYNYDQGDSDEIIPAEETLKTIATKTDSRFEEWLQSLLQPLSEEDETEDETIGSFKYNGIRHQNHLASSYVILSNLQSGMNIGNILRSASIFGCTECIVVGQKRHRLTGDHGSRFDLPRRHFFTHQEAKSYLKANAIENEEEVVKIYGVEIMENASPLMKYDAETGVMTFPFGDRCRSTGAAFVMGNEGLGLSEKQKEICDDFIFIPQTRGGASSSSSPTSRDEQGNGRGSASLNVSCAAAIILQAYSVWANYPVASIEGEKFVASQSSRSR